MPTVWSRRWRADDFSVILLTVTDSYLLIPSKGRMRPADDTPTAGYSCACSVPGMETATFGSVLARFGQALSDPTRARILLALRDAPGYPSELADLLGVSRQSLSNHLTCLRGCGLVVAVPEGRRARYELADPRLGHALTDLMGTVLAVDPAYCAAAADQDCC
jgi:DNA-binding transcriptional ArsR family regulator